MFRYANLEMFSPKESDKNKIMYLFEEQIRNLYNLGFYSKKERNTAILNGRFKEGLKCPRCGHSRVNKNGITNGRQRYICKNCKRTFDERTLSPLSNTKLSLEKWIKYCKCMVEGGTIRDCAKEVSVSVPTSFFMRHRILDVINIVLKDEILEGVVGTEVCYLNESFKGARVKEQYFSPFNKNNLGLHLVFNKIVESGSNMMKNVKENQICINTAIDAKGKILTRVVDNNFAVTDKKNSRNMVSFFDGKVKPGSTLCIYMPKTYRDVSKNLNLNVIRVSKTARNIYTAHHAFEYNLKFREWIRNFNGVATKYLNNYLSWFKFLYVTDKFKYLGRIKDLFMKFSIEDIYITKDMIKNRYVELI